MKAVELVFRAYEDGNPAVFVTGNSLYEFNVDTGGKIRPFVEIIKSEAREKFGMVAISYSRAAGIDYDSAHISDERDRRTIESALKARRLADIPTDQNEVVKVIRGISSFSRTPTDGLKWATENRPMKFLFLFEFSEDLVPGGLQNGTETDAQIVARELVFLTSNSLALRKSGNFLIFHGRDLIDDLVASALYQIRLVQPDPDEKKEFLTAASTLYTKAKFEDGLTSDVVVNLTKNTPNRSLEQLMRASHRSGRIITAIDLVEQKNRDVELLSEHTLRVLDTERVKDLQLQGHNIQIPKKLLERFADSLRRGDARMQANIVLAGAPGTGKTDLAIYAAEKAGVAAYELLSPKGSFVGETERKARLQWMVLKQWVPAIAFVDEITESLPLERTEFEGDSGASRAVFASLLTALSDETRRGKNLLIATTNCPWRMSQAMANRFVVIPVLHPLIVDFPEIVVATARRIVPECNLDPNDPRIKEASIIFFEKGGNVRNVRAALTNAIQLHGKLTPDAALFAAHDLCAATDIVSAIYADLHAIRCTTSRSFFPWGQSPSTYTFPDHLKGIVNSTTGEVDYKELNRKLEELRPYANV